MKTFREMALNETIHNLFTDIEKEKYVDDIWKLLQDSYKSIGGLKGSGFNNKEEMIHKIKMWKIVRKDFKVVAGLLYKDKGMRKTVAIFTDGSKEAKRAITNILKDDFERSYIEVSHSLLKFLEKKMPIVVKKYVVDTSTVQNILGKEIDIISSTKYSRDINGSTITKMMIGNVKKFYL